MKQTGSENSVIGGSSCWTELLLLEDVSDMTYDKPMSLSTLLGQWKQKAKIPLSHHTQLYARNVRCYSLVKSPP